LAKIIILFPPLCTRQLAGYRLGKLKTFLEVRDETDCYQVGPIRRDVWAIPFCKLPLYIILYVVK